MHEFPLVIFTLFMQASVGCLVVALICYFRVLGGGNDIQNVQFIKRPVLASFVLGCVGLLGSLFHMGNPLHMFYTMLHVSTSWMSREVWATAIYMGLLFFSVALLLLKQKANAALLVLSAIAGLMYMYAMSALYANTLFNLWNGLFTYASFFGAVLLVGGVVAALLLVGSLRRSAKEEQVQRVVKITLGLGIMGILLMLLGALSLLGNIGEPIYLGMTQREMPEGLLSLSLVRVVLIALGILFVGRLLCQKTGQNTNATVVMSLATLCIFAGEGVGRVVFFSLGG
ncbi:MULTISPECIES: dimethyl sulfoxide reductase anchor subunit family protein [Providencia]|uniref:Dimethyl sulfoxide reductase anchor subunit n=1 Tax=Providencia huashanensis TaxID=3037798 RepID=A0AA42FHA6_9GAMM|nr:MULTISPECIES: DmsC/YnfH family molybdoenzyme membrane anchor subunit [Providencia]EJD6083738.1 dimethyl sulfoxide reductase anchor subunit [Providencia rettgeri]EJD6408950.1 dimethyl sulfoxide reductase anchor subunit [Providencia rettgeri]EJD6412322.1 dimethyl sulfoxide reductase anchor subunit [Providencia rettgeri]EJD6497720.1 dimethyl sulfoxide reductase anchor subunit [Providencia rettgeri]EJD6601006.1 dimethyl sulfoxide reductase anchor subunit [Providencia rettgeri]